MDESYNQATHSTTTGRALAASEAGWRIYPIWPVDEQRVCTCPRRDNCGSPGKHPWTRHGIKDATSDQQEIAAMFAERPGANVGLATGKDSGVVALDLDTWHGGGQSLTDLETQYGKLPPTRLDQSQKDLHWLFSFPQHLERLPSRVVAPGLELKADGAGLVLPPSRGVYSYYSVLIEGPMAPLPQWIVDLATKLHVIEGDGPEKPTASKYVLPERIHESSPSRNRTLYGYGCSLRAHGWSHSAILTELRKVNAERCIPPLGDSEVRNIAKSAAAHEPGKASYVSPEVLEAVAYLDQKARTRQKRGTAAYSRWAVYRALLDTAKAHGSMHEGRDVAVSISIRDLALGSGVSKPTTSKALKALDESHLVYRVTTGEGSKAGSLALRVPARRAHPLPTLTTGPRPGEGLRNSHSDTSGVSMCPSAAPAVLYKVRHGYGIGKVKGEILEISIESGKKGVSRSELARQMSMKPESLRRHLKELVEIGLIERPGRGRYRPVEGWAKILDRELTMSGETKAVRLEEAAFERERQAYRRYLAEKQRTGKE